MRQIYLYSLATLTVRQIVWQIVRLMKGTHTHACSIASTHAGVQRCSRDTEAQNHKNTKLHCLLGHIHAIHDLK